MIKANYKVSLSLHESIFLSLSQRIPWKLLIYLDVFSHWIHHAWSSLWLVQWCYCIASIINQQTREMIWRFPWGQRTKTTASIQKTGTSDQSHPIRLMLSLWGYTPNQSGGGWLFLPVPFRGAHLEASHRNGAKRTINVFWSQINSHYKTNP